MNPKLQHFLTALDDDDLPDGAWWAKLEDGVTEWNRVNGTNLNTHETIEEYDRLKSEAAPTIYGLECPNCQKRLPTVGIDPNILEYCSEATCNEVFMIAVRIVDYNVWMQGVRQSRTKKIVNLMRKGLTRGGFK